MKRVKFKTYLLIVILPICLLAYLSIMPFYCTINIISNYGKYLRGTLVVKEIITVKRSGGKKSIGGSYSYVEGEINGVIERYIPNGSMNINDIDVGDRIDVLYNNEMPTTIIQRTTLRVIDADFNLYRNLAFVVLVVLLLYLPIMCFMVMLYNKSPKLFKYVD